MKKLTTYLSFLLIFIILLSFSLTGCNGGDDTSDDASGNTGSGDLVPHLGKADYSGKTLRVLASLENDVFGDAQIAPEEFNSEPVNDAVVERNRRLEGEYGFNIEVIYAPDFDKFTDRVRQDMMSGSDDYDVISSGLMYLAPLVVDGLLLDLKTIEDSHLKLDEDWWDTASNKDMSIGNKLFFTTGDIFVLDDENTRLTYFNKDLIDEYGLDNPYDLVKEGKWTLDNMYKMMKAVAHEDGDGVMNVTGDDVWGLVGGAFEAYQYILGCNCPQIYKDEDDIPYLGMVEEKSVNAFMKVFDMFTDKSTVAYIEQYYKWDDPDAPTVTDNFYSGNALFYAAFMFTVNNEKMRESSINYGVLPQPKYDENQENYASTVNPYRFYCLSITEAAQDLDFITFALEAMAYTSKEIVTPEYYDRTLKLKRFDDSASPEMLDIIFSNRIVDLSVVFNWADCIQWYNRMLFGNNNGIVSYVEAQKEMFDTQMEATLDSIFRHEQ